MDNTNAASAETATFPPTRYQGSKRRLLGWIGEHVEHLAGRTVLDAFGGTGSVAYLFKRLGWQVTYNDLLASNAWVGAALIENNRQTLSPAAASALTRRDPGVAYDDIVERTFGGIYFTVKENRWIDTAVQNIRRVKQRHIRAIAYRALFQACLAKRPYNLFHRRNLYMRTANVQRGFGNKTTWDRSFDDHFIDAVEQTNAAVFDNGTACTVLRGEALDVDGAFDLVYVDPPYVSDKNVGVDYAGFYHFLDGLADYANWPRRIDYKSKHRRLRREPSAWTSGKTNLDAFRALFERFADATLVVSYRSDGLPSIDELAAELHRVRGNVRVSMLDRYQYVLSKNRTSREVLLIAD